jgi:hypothetical protein
MSITNYSELQTAIANWLDRDDLTAKIPDFITLAESYLNRDLRLRSMITETTINPSQAVKYVDLPTGYRESIAFADDHGEEILQLHHEDLLEHQYGSSSGRPTFYSVTNRINFDRVADASYNFTLTYYKALDLQSDLTNSVLSDYPDMYLYGALLQAEPYLKNDSRISVWLGYYENAKKAANNRNNRSRVKLRSDHPAISTGFNVIRGW